MIINSIIINRFIWYITKMNLHLAIKGLLKALYKLDLIE